MLIYHERQQTYLIFYLILFVEIPVMLYLISWGLGQKEYGATLLMAILTGGILFLLSNFFHMNIRVYDNRLWVNFGVFSKTIVFSDIRKLSIEPYKFKKYLGWGIHYSISDKSRAWVTRSGRGIRIRTDSHDYFFSSENPEHLAELIKSKMTSK